MADSEFQQLAKSSRNPVQETRYQELLKQQGTGGGGGYQLPDITGLAKQQTEARNTLIGQQNAATSDFMNRYRTALAGQEGTSALAGRIGEELGIPTLRSNAFALQNTLQNIPSVQKQATRGFDASQNQVDRLVAHKQAEIAPSATAATQQVQNAEGQLTTRMGYEQADQAKQMQPYQTEATLLNERLAREMTGFDTGAQSELSALISQMNAGITLNEGQANRANQLAIQENSFENAKTNVQKTTQIVETGGVKKLIDSSTGSVIAIYSPPTSTPTPTIANVANQYGANNMASVDGKYAPSSGGSTWKL